MELSGFISSASVSAAGMAISSLWQGLLLAAFAWICLKRTPHLSAGTRFSVWCAVFVANLLLPVLSLAHPSNGSVVSGAGEASHSVVRLDSRWALAIAAVWLLIATARTIGLIGNAFRVRTIYRNSTPADTNASLQPLLEERAATPRTVEVYSSNRVDQPCVIGFFRPRVLVPEWLLAKATPAEMRQIVLHEASHLRRWDDWTNLLQKLALIVFPLNPALWWIERQLCSAREEACDERVVRETRSPREYATCLTNLAAERMARRTGRTAALSLGAWEHRSALAERIHSILRSGSQLSPAKARAVMAALAIATIGGAVELSKTSQLVAFTTPEPSASELAHQPVSAIPPASAYHDVVFREPIARQHVVGPKVIAANAVLPPERKANREAEPVSATFGNHPARPKQPSVRRVSFPADESRSWIVVTRWESLSDRQQPVMVIQRVVRFSSSADPALANGVATLQTQSGWFIFRL